MSHRVTHEIALSSAYLSPNRRERAEVQFEVSSARDGRPCVQLRCGRLTGPAFEKLS